MIILKVSYKYDLITYIIIIFKYIMNPIRYIFH